MEHKAFCSKCKYLFRYEVDGVLMSYDCKHPNNIKLIKEHNWYHEYTYEIENRYPEFINKNNNCKWYEMSI